MPDTSKYKSVGMRIESYEKLKKLSEDERRSVGQQASKLIDEAFENKYKAKAGIASSLVLQQPSTAQTT